MQWLKQAQTRLEPHFNRALLLSILACLVILLTYLFGGAGAFVALRQRLFPTTASSVLTTGAPPTSGAGSTSSKSGAPNSAASPAVATSLAAMLQVSPLDLPLNCALGAVATSSVTLTNPDRVAHSVALAWNGASNSVPGFLASLHTGGLAGTVPAHGTQGVTIAVLPLSLDPTADSQYLWVIDTTAGASNVAARVHISCSTLPSSTPALPIPTLPVPTPTLPLP